MVDVLVWGAIIGVVLGTIEYGFQFFEAVVTLLGIAMLGFGFWALWKPSTSYPTVRQHGVGAGPTAKAVGNRSGLAPRRLHCSR